MAVQQSLTPEKEYLRIDKKICRLCGDGKDYNKSTCIFGKAGREKKLAEKIEKTLNIIIEESQYSRLPCNVCRQCQSCLETFNEFKAVALETQDMLKKNSFSKRCAKSPHPEPAKRSHQQQSSHPKHLQYSVSNTIHPLHPDDSEHETEDARSTQEIISTCGLNDKTVCICTFVVSRFYIFSASGLF